MESKLFNRVLVILNALASLCTILGFVGVSTRSDVVFLIVFLLISGIICWVLIHSFNRLVRLNLLLLLGLSLVLIALVFCSWLLLKNKKVRPIEVKIEEPRDSAIIHDDRYLIRGKVSDINAQVHVLIRPFQPNDYWVQDPPTIDSDGNWQVSAHFGESVNGIGDKYEIIAIATHENFLVTRFSGNDLKVGRTCCIPANTNRSKYITVKRLP